MLYTPGLRPTNTAYATFGGLFLGIGHPCCVCDPLTERQDGDQIATRGMVPRG